MVSDSTSLDATTARRIAIAAEALYLCNLLLLPLFAFVLLLILHHRYAPCADPVAGEHLHQTVSASLWAGVLLIPVPLLTLAISGLNSPGGWTITILYIVICHTSLVLTGILGLARAMAGKPFRFPLIGGRAVR